MVAKGWGRVVFISSESALNIPKEMIHYGMTKTAQLAISRGLAESVANTGVTVNAVLPGPTLSEGVEEMLRGMTEDGVSIEEAGRRFIAQYRPTSLIGRLATPEEVANLVVYTCSPQASATSGAALRVDGGCCAASAEPHIQVWVRSYWHAAAASHGANPLPDLDADFHPPHLLGTAAACGLRLPRRDVRPPAGTCRPGAVRHGSPRRLADGPFAGSQPVLPPGRGRGAAGGGAVARPGVPPARPGRFGAATARLHAPGDLMMNAPLDFLTTPTGVRLDLAFLLPGQPLPNPLPDHDVAIVAASESAAGLLDELASPLRAWPRPVLNDPARIRTLSRDWLAGALAGLPGVTAAPTIRTSRAALERGEVPVGYPALLRPVESTPATTS